MRMEVRFGPDERRFEVWQPRHVDLTSGAERSDTILAQAWSPDGTVWKVRFAAQGSEVLDCGKDRERAIGRAVTVAEEYVLQRRTPGRPAPRSPRADPAGT